MCNGVVLRRDTCRQLVNKAFCVVLMTPFFVLYAVGDVHHLHIIQFAVVRIAFLRQQIDVAETCNSTQLCFMLQSAEERFHTFVDSPFVESRILYRSFV